MSARILVVDDDEILAASLAAYFKMHGHEVTVAPNGLEAVNRFRERNFAIAFMDVDMPVMNGVDSFLAVRALRPDAKVVMMTGSAEPTVNRALESGALGLLHKPFPLSDLLANLRHAARAAA
jgi:CheY-like chemotaxis protein